VQLAGWPTSLIRTYEDYVLGKLFADTAFERAGDALRPYQGRDRAKGLAFLISQMRQRVGFPGVLLSPGTLKLLRDTEARDVLAEGWESMLQHDGPMQLLASMYEQLVNEMRNTSEVLGAEDIFELERRTAIAQFGQRVALRQVLQAARTMEETLPRQKPRSPGRRYEVPTRILEEDTYPVGGFSSISTRGSIESLLHSQLAYMERDDRPDLFDIKFLRDELLFYSRDENSFLRRRRTFVFALYPDLSQARFKDSELPYQRIILLLALLETTVRKLIDWLSADALRFEFIVITAKDASSLSAERELLDVLLTEQIANGTVTIESMPANKLADRCIQRARRSLCHCVLMSVKEQTLEAAGAIVSRLVLDRPIPSLGIDRDPLTPLEADTAWLAWLATLERLLVNWI
jgi:hypothetical protein